MRTSITHPLRIDWLPVEGDKGCIGMTLCPGKYQPVAQTGSWDRQLDLDIEVLKENSTSTLISLVTQEDMELLRVTQLPEGLEASGIEWIHLPLPDMSIPTRKWLRRSVDIFTKLQTSITKGERVVVHCMGGLSRAGTFVSIYLHLRGYTMAAAIEKVRTERSAHCINEEQEKFLFELEEQQMNEFSKIETFTQHGIENDSEIMTWGRDYLCNAPVNSVWCPYGSGAEYKKSDSSTWLLTSIVGHPYSLLSHELFTQLMNKVGLTMDDNNFPRDGEEGLSYAEYSVRILFNM